MVRNRQPTVRERLTQVEELFVELILLFLVLVNATNVISRYVLHRSIGQTFELMILLAVVMYWVGIGTAQRHGGHLGMSFLVSRLPRVMQSPLRALRKAVIAGFLIVTAFSGAVPATVTFIVGFCEVSKTSPNR